MAIDFLVLRGEAELQPFDCNLHLKSQLVDRQLAALYTIAKGALKKADQTYNAAASPQIILPQH